MENLITSVPPESSQSPAPMVSRPRLIPQNMINARADRVELGSNGPVSTAEATQIIYERAMARLQGVVDEAWEQLGLEPSATLDTSNEATAGRIVDFVERAFEGWRQGRSELGDAEAREQYVAFITPAIEQGITEARDILQALQAMTPEVEMNITAIGDIINQRLADFVSGTG